MERSVPALLGLARVSGIGTARRGTGFSCIRALEVNLKEYLGLAGGGALSRSTTRDAVCARGTGMRCGTEPDVSCAGAPRVYTRPRKVYCLGKSLKPTPHASLCVSDHMMSCNKG